MVLTGIVRRLAVLLFVAAAFLQIAPAQQSAAALSDEERNQFEEERLRLDKRLDAIKVDADLQADARVFLKAIQWTMGYETKLEAKDVLLVKNALKRAQERVDALADGKATWPRRQGKLVRGFVSAVDGSVQPYGLSVPAGYDPSRASRLDVVLHGSMKSTGLNELRFLAGFDEGDEAGKAGPAQDYLELRPLGRVENGYRWAGETDVFEAIEAVARNYKVDRDRIVLRGMSMGASGTWHLGLKNVDRFVALGPYCGYVDTFHFSRTPLGSFVKVGPLPAYQEKMLHMVDSIDYAANAGVVPAIACMGEKDVFFQAHVLMGQAMEKEGLKMVNLISPGTGHVIDPVTFKEQMRRIHDIADKGLDHNPRRLRFVTWTLKYGRCHWLRVLGLEEHYSRAEFDSEVAEDGTIDVKEAKNISRFAILPPAWRGEKPRLRIDGKEVTLPAIDGKALKAVIGRRDGKWVYLGGLDAMELPGKVPGLQGPIDDAFTTPFLCVRGTGKAWNANVQKWADASLKRFTHEWARYFRGDLRVKDDKDVTAEDMRKYNLILFGDPGGNSLVRKVLPNLPIQWTQAELTVAGKKYAAAEHAPLLIQPSPLAKGRYVVLNSGHTFREKELASLNYLLFPRLGDWAVLKVGGKTPDGPSGPLEEEMVRTGFCDEEWRVGEKNNPDLAEFLGLGDYYVKPVTARKDPKTGFIVGGKNDTALIKELKEINGKKIGDLEKYMRPGAMIDDFEGSDKGFIGPDESLLEVLVRDNQYVVGELGLSHQELAKHLHAMGTIGHWQRAAAEFVYHGRHYKVKLELSRGYQWSPFQDGTKTDTIAEVHNLDNGKKIGYSLLVPFMVERYGFYEGKGTPYRVEPGQVVEVFDFLKAKESQKK